MCSLTELSLQPSDCGIPSIEYAPPDRAGAMIDRVKEAADGAGRDPDSLTLAYNVTVGIGDPDPHDPHRISGSSEAIAQQLIEFTRLGFNAFNLIPVGPDGADDVAQLGREVLPAVRARH